MCNIRIATTFFPIVRMQRAGMSFHVTSLTGSYVAKLPHKECTTAYNPQEEFSKSLPIENIPKLYSFAAAITFTAL